MWRAPPEAIPVVMPGFLPRLFGDPLTGLHGLRELGVPARLSIMKLLHDYYKNNALFFIYTACYIYLPSKGTGTSLRTMGAVKCAGKWDFLPSIGAVLVCLRATSCLPTRHFQTDFHTFNGFYPSWLHHYHHYGYNALREAFGTFGKEFHDGKERVRSLLCAHQPWLNDHCGRN